MGLTFTFIIGLIGMIILVIAWIPQTVEVIKNRKSSIPGRFSAIYSIASLFLTFYAMSINDLIFTILNFLAFLQSFLNFLFRVK